MAGGVKLFIREQSMMVMIRPRLDDNGTACMIYVSGAAGDNLGAAYLLCVVYVVGSLI